jgi:hypothetical protein
MYADAVPQRTVHLLILLTPDFSLQPNTTAQKKEKKNKIHFFNLCFSSFTGGGWSQLPQPEIGDSVLLPATLLDLSKTKHSCHNLSPHLLHPKELDQQHIYKPIIKTKLQRKLHSLMQRTNLQIHQKEHPKTNKETHTHTHTHNHKRKQHLETSLYKTTSGYLAKKIQLRIISQTSLLPSSSSAAASCSRFTMICEILQPSPSPHPKEATEFFLSRPNPSRPVVLKPNIKSSHHLEWLLGGDGRGQNNEVDGTCAWGRRSPTRTKKNKN